MNDSLGDRINAIIGDAVKLDWKEQSFSIEKAYVCARLSEIVYEDVKEYELKKASRIHLFQSSKYSSIVKSGKTNDILTSLSQSTEDSIMKDYQLQFFIVRNRYAITLATIFRDIVILTVRGTVFSKLWDWKTNVDIRKYRILIPFHYRNSYFRDMYLDDTFFHRGFFEAIVPQLTVIIDEVKKRCPSSPTTIIWTGHSLGGAMAAIGNAILNPTFQKMCWDDKNSRELGGAYTFGMPRYCGLGAICSFCSPYHILKYSDPIPTLPPRCWGFVDSSNEYMITDSGDISSAERSDSFGLISHIRLKLDLIDLHNHSIEGYVKLLSKACSNGSNI